MNAAQSEIPSRCSWFCLLFAVKAATALAQAAAASSGKSQNPERLNMISGSMSSCRLLAQTILILFTFISSSLAFWPPLQSVTTGIEQSGTKERMWAKVYDPVKGTWQWSYSDYKDNIWPPAMSSGIAAWVEQTDLSSSPYHSYQVRYAVYDPGRGSWRGGSSYSVDYIWNLRVQDGVVAWVEQTDLSSSPYHSYRVRYVVYEPISGMWRSGQSYEVDRVVGLAAMAKDGVVAWVEQTDLSHSPYHSYQVGYSIYDPVSGSWRTGHSYEGDSASVTSISNATVTYVLEGRTYQRGYSGGSWISGWTVPLSYFVATPSYGSPPLTVWFTDMSIGATAWGFNFGDGSSIVARSTYHTYNGYNLYAAVQSITGPQGAHSTSQSIRTDSVAPLGSIIINNGNSHSSSALVTLTVSATDNSGSVASMRFSNDAASWSGWEPYGTTKSWSLTAGEGLKTVYVQFMDLAGNASGSYSDSITLILNDAPTDIGLSPATVAENQPTDADIGTLSTVDPDAGDTFVYSLVPCAGATDNALFAIGGNTLRAAISFDYEARTSCSIRIRSQDQGGLAVEKVFTITITPAPLSVVYVNRANQNPYPNGSQWAPFPTFTQGYLAARDGNTIRFVGEGTPTDYPEKLENMSKAVTIEAPSVVVNIGKGAPP